MEIRKKRKVAFIICIAMLLSLLQPVAQHRANASEKDYEGILEPLYGDGAVRMAFGTQYHVNNAGTMIPCLRFDTTAERCYYQIKAYSATGSAVKLNVCNEKGERVVPEFELVDRQYARLSLEKSKKYFIEESNVKDESWEIAVTQVYDDYEDTIADAEAIEFNREYSFTSDMTDDVDVAKLVTGDIDAAYTLSLEAIGESEGTYEVLNADGNSLEGASGNIDSSEDVSIELPLASSSTYYLRIKLKGMNQQVIASISQKERSYSIKYNLDGGTNDKANPSTYTTKTKKISLKSPVKSKYVFLGWYTDENFENQIKTIDPSAKTNYTLYAKWQKLTLKKVVQAKPLSPKKGQVKVSYKKVFGAKGYEISLSTSSDFKTEKKYTTTAGSKVIKNQTGGVTYYVRVRAYAKDSKKATIYGKYSAVKKVRVLSKNPSKKKKKGGKKR